MADFKRIIQRTTNSERVETGVADLQPNEICIVEDGEELIYKDRNGKFISVSKDKYTVDNIENLKKSTKYKIGDIIHINGYNSKEDGSYHKRIISYSNNGLGIKIANGLWANEITFNKTERIFMGFRSNRDTKIDVYRGYSKNNFKKIIETDLNLRDPSFIFINDCWYITGTSVALNENVEFKIYKTNDFKSFCIINAKLGLINQDFNKIWAPEFFIDLDNKIYIMATINIGTEADISGNIIPKHKPFFVEFFEETETFSNPIFFKMPDETNRIDCFMLRESNRYLLTIKNEYNKNTQILQSLSLDGNFTLIKEVDLGIPLEGVSLLKENNGYTLYGDNFSKYKYYVSSFSKDLIQWSNFEFVSFNNSVRHGGFLDIKIDSLAYKNILKNQHYNNNILQNYIDLSTLCDSTGSIGNLNLANNAVYYIDGNIPNKNIKIDKFSGNIEKCYFVLRLPDGTLNTSSIILNSVNGGEVIISVENGNNDVFNEIRMWRYGDFDNTYVYCGQRSKSEITSYRINLEELAINGIIENFNPKKNGVYYLSGGSVITINSIVGFDERPLIDRVRFKFNTASLLAKIIIKGSIYNGIDCEMSNKDGLIGELILDGYKRLSPSFGFATALQAYDNLDTHYMALRMKQEGVYDDFIDYMDRKLTYNKKQIEVEKQYQQEYEQFIKDNKYISYDDFMANKPSTLMSEYIPIPSNNLIKFKEKYYG